MNNTLNEIRQGRDDEVRSRWQPTLIWRPARASERACCCPARPAFQAVLPPSNSRTTPVEILLCGHHYRASRATLDSQGVATYDIAGRAVTLPA